MSKVNVDTFGWFKTTQYGGICLNVKKIVEDRIRCFEVDIKTEYLKNFIISTSHKYSITDRIILISNFGIVDNHEQIYNCDPKIKKSIILYEFKDVYPYFYDTADTDNRLKTIYKLNLDKFEPILVDINRRK